MAETKVQESTKSASTVFVDTYSTILKCGQYSCQPVLPQNYFRTCWMLLRNLRRVGLSGCQWFSWAYHMISMNCRDAAKNWVALEDRFLNSSASWALNYCSNEKFTACLMTISHNFSAYCKPMTDLSIGTPRSLKMQAVCLNDVTTFPLFQLLGWTVQCWTYKLSLFGSVELWRWWAEKVQMVWWCSYSMPSTTHCRGRCSNSCISVGKVGNILNKVGCLE